MEAKEGCCNTEKASQEDSAKENAMQYYGEHLKSTEDLRTGACTTNACTKPSKRITDMLKKVPEEINSKFYGCGSPIPLGIEGKQTLDIGCGSGRDCYMMSLVVGKQGKVNGIDITKEQIDVALKHREEFEQANEDSARMEFHIGEMESITESTIEKATIDIAVSNCVINLSGNKKKVFEEAFAILKEGGEMHFSDIYSDVELPASFMEDPLLHGECLAGALTISSFRNKHKDAGFPFSLQVSSDEVQIGDEEIKKKLNGAVFSSKTMRVFKLKKGWEDDHSLNNGASVTYKGSIKNSEEEYTLCEGTSFKLNECVNVEKDIALILKHSWLSEHFDVH
jgi:ubiquinone/menaquinone biosynthesis C-methylase UbiE